MRLQIVRTVDNDPQELFKKVEFVRIPVRLGDDAFKDGKISKDKARIFNKAMKAFMLMMEVFEVDYYMACATSALREASNGHKVAQKVFEKTGLKIRIIDGKEESQIILRSIDTLFEKNKNYLTINCTGRFFNVVREGNNSTAIFFNNTFTYRDWETDRKSVV